jgi:PP-loop superfamily ATP-utilizing enzyme
VATGPDQECEWKLLGSDEMRSAAVLADRSGVAVLHAPFVNEEHTSAAHEHISRCNGCSSVKESHQATTSHLLELTAQALMDSVVSGTNHGELRCETFKPQAERDISAAGQIPALGLRRPAQ